LTKHVRNTLSLNHPPPDGQEANMADLDALKSKYQPVIDEITSFSDLGSTLTNLDLTDEKLHIKGSVPSTVVNNRVWDVIKSVDATYADLNLELANTGGDEQPYTVKSGDNLSKIAERFYGHANKYNEIAQANNIDNPDLIKIGQDLSLPVLS
jgi:LysM repeat protein